MPIRHLRTCAVLVVTALGLAVHAQPVFLGADVFPREEFAARRARVFDAIGDGVAVLQGTTERPGEQPLRQSNQFFYLTGIVEPRALAILDGHSKRTVVFLQPDDARRRRQIDRMFGVGLVPGTEAAQATGVEEVLPRPAFADALAEIAKDGRAIFTCFRPEVLGSASAHDTIALAAATKQDPWDGRVSREEAFIAHLKAAAPRSEIKDLDPVLDGLRQIKSVREIAVIRQATVLAGGGIIEAMRDTEPGLHEYELQADAEYVFKRGGAYGPSYFALIATGTNTLYSHYHANTAVLKDGDLVQFDYAPDYKNYSSDVTRVFPANGRFTPRQRELYGIYLRLYQALMTSIAVHTAPAAIATRAVDKMEGIMRGFAFTDPAIRDAAQAFVDGYKNRPVKSLGHWVGMEVHDVGPSDSTLEPGMVFTIEPAMQLPAEHIGVRLEDMILITDTGYENLSAFVPIEIDEIEKTMAQPAMRPK
jgi:Xaa-Pro aminopeptidase